MINKFTNSLRLQNFSIIKLNIILICNFYFLKYVYDTR